MDFRRASAYHKPQHLLQEIAARFDPARVAISFSGAEDVVLIDMAQRAGLQFNIFSLDTGRLHPETYAYLERVREHYGVAIELLMPQPQAVADLVQEKGLFSFYKDGHGECCGVRKIEPLRRKLRTLDAWITGQRKDQSVTRTNILLEHEDRAFSTKEHPLLKFNPFPTGPHRTSGPTFALRRCRTTNCTTAASYPSAASPAPAPSVPTSMNAAGAGGGRRPPTRNAGCIRKTWSGSWVDGWAVEGRCASA